ncbi:unnamed protein product [Acanthoscelides obtectus]|uniref:RabBD domain-containing protein n=1 Tax=Acanthoscelides obtectus TaxID=200917 RepID=A0A9P0Q346_ACAOB|nr:unnamed protein product [Acanthoscelides obtectus]CAK1635354.1 hypothetical protein AOBTE_LOCUS9226 [Acanthoscelides obtectus]
MWQGGDTLTPNKNELEQSISVASKQKEKVVRRIDDDTPVPQTSELPVMSCCQEEACTHSVVAAAAMEATRLSDKEREIILGVLAKDERLRRDQQIRVLMLFKLRIELVSDAGYRQYYCTRLSWLKLYCTVLYWKHVFTLFIPSKGIKSPNIAQLEESATVKALKKKIQQLQEKIKLKK